MNKRKVFVTAVSCLFLMAFDDTKREVLVENCVKAGTAETSCRCAFDSIEKAMGARFLDAVYLQVTGDLQGYEKALYELIAENPQTFELAARAEVEAQAQCMR